VAKRGRFAGPVAGARQLNPALSSCSPPSEQRGVARVCRQTLNRPEGSELAE